MGARRVTLKIQPPVPYGEVTLVPSMLSGRSDADMAAVMAEALADVEVPTASDVYKRLRHAFPLAPLSARVTALAFVMSRLRRSC